MSFSNYEALNIAEISLKSVYPPIYLSGRWQAPAAVLPEGPKDQEKSHSRARRAREWLKPASPRARRARGRAKLSRRLPVLLYVFPDSAKNRDFQGTI